MPDIQSSQDQNTLIPARYYVRAATLLLAQGVDVQTALMRAGLDLTSLSRDDAQLSLGQIEVLLGAVLEATPRRDLPLDLGRSIQLLNHSVAGYAILSSPSVDYALRLTARFFGLIFPAFKMQYRPGPQTAEIIFRPSLAMSHPVLLFHLETIAVAAHYDIQELLDGPMPVYDLYFSMPPPAHLRRYTELKNARCHFMAEDRPGVRLVLPAHILQRQPATADPAALRLAEQRCRDLLASMRARNDVGGWVQMMLRESSGGLPSLTELAHTLSVSARTLDRYLQNEGLSFRQMQQNLLHQRACELLHASAQSVTSIAYELGYSDAANFTRAFRKIAGCSPSAYRLKDVS